MRPGRRNRLRHMRVSGSHFIWVKIGGLSGSLLGLAVVAHQRTPVWPRLSLMVSLRATALGWLIGIAVCALAGWALSRRAREAVARPRSGWRRAGSAALTVGFLAPAVIWMAAVPNGLVRRTLVGGGGPWDARPNLVLITIDALRADHLGAYGDSAGLTLNIDRFAAEATRYDSAYAAAPWTLPSFGAMFTSLPPSECGLKTTARELEEWYVWTAKLPGEIPLLSERLQRAGYTTAAEITNPFLAGERGWGRGFDYFRNEDGSLVGNILTRADTVTENSLSWLALNPSRPFFLWVHYMDPHAPYSSPDTPPELRAKYPPTWLTRRPHWHEEMQYEDEETRARYQEFCRMMYAEEVRYADRWVGELLRGLKEAGLYHNSLVVITSDHGEELFDHGQFEHGHSMHEEVLRVPLLIKMPEGRPADPVVTQTVGLAALGQTFLELAGADPSGPAGETRIPLRDGAPGAEVYSEGMLYGLEMTALTSDDYKIMFHPYGDSAERRFEVYDRKSDRGEHHDLAGTAVASGLREQLERRTEAARLASAQWERRGGSFRSIDLSEESQSKLRTLGYLGD